MKNLPYIAVALGLVALFLYSFLDGLDREAKRQCIVAKDTCEKYAYAGACEPKYLAVCEGVEDDE